VLDDLGSTLLELVAGDPTEASDIGGIVFYDPFDEPVWPHQALVLGVGVGGTDQIVDLLNHVGERGAVGLVVREPVAAAASVVAAADRSGVALVSLTAGASWAQLSALLTSLLADGEIGDPGHETLAGLPSGDLFTLANAIAALLDAPIIIEDRNSRVLAFSGRQDEADRSRIDTILGRQVPQPTTRLLEERGVFRELFRADGPVFIPAPDGGADGFRLPRVALAVRAGDEILGSMWAAVREPLSDERAEAFREASNLVAMHLLRQRAGADVSRRLQTDLVSTTLEGGPGVADAASRLGISGRPGLVLALSLLDADDADTSLADAQRVGELQRVSAAFALHLSAVHPRASVALLGDATYGILPITCDLASAERMAVQTASNFLDRIGDRIQAVVAVGPAVLDVDQLAGSRKNADRILRVLRDRRIPKKVARMSDVHVEVLLLEMGDVIAAHGDVFDGPIGRLRAHDQHRSGYMVETLTAWLESFGDVIAASAAIRVHPNTFRYRLRRVSEVGQIDLTNADERFAALLQLRLLNAMPRRRSQ
jgi:hypothetical protein